MLNIGNKTAQNYNLREKRNKQKTGLAVQYPKFSAYGSRFQKGGSWAKKKLQKSLDGFTELLLVIRLDIQNGNISETKSDKVQSGT